MAGRRFRDPDLLDAVEAAPRRDIDLTLWRMSREGRDPLLGHPSFGRWDDGSFEVLYTALSREGAIAEVDYHLRQGQPVYPARARYQLVEMAARLTDVLDLSDWGVLENLGLARQQFGRLPYGQLRAGEYSRSQQIGEIAHFLGDAGLLVPSARIDGENAVIICANADCGALRLARSHGVEEMKAWVAR